MDIVAELPAEGYPYHLVLHLPLAHELPGLVEAGLKCGGRLAVAQPDVGQVGEGAVLDDMRVTAERAVMVNHATAVGGVNVVIFYKYLYIFVV